MSRNTNGLLVNNDNIYGLVNPPPIPLIKDGALIYQDPSSGAVRWDNFVDLSNTGFSFQPASFNFTSIVEKIPWGPKNVYPLYNAGQIKFTQTKTFSKLRIYFRDRTAYSIQVPPRTLYNELPRNQITPGPISTGNWVDISLNPSVGPPLPTNTGITNAINGIWDVSGGGPNGENFKINPNGWQLGFDLRISEHTDTGLNNPAATPNWLGDGGSWNSAVDVIKLPYNPQGWAFVNGTTQIYPAPDTPAPPPGVFGPSQTPPNDLSPSEWSTPLWTSFGKYINSQQYKTRWINQHIFYIEFSFGNPGLTPTSTFTPNSVTFTAGKIYLAELSMYNMNVSNWNSGTNFNVEALTSLELII